MAKKATILPNTKQEHSIVFHSIKKYEETTPTTHYPVVHYPVNNQPHTPLHYWSQARCECFLEAAKARGYVIGTKIITTWGRNGTICKYKEFPVEGIRLPINKEPDLFGLEYDHPTHSHSTNIFFSLDEISLVQK